MKTVYVKHNGQNVSVTVTDEQERVITETRRAIWSNESYERYHRAASLNAMTDHDKRTSCTATNPEAIYIAVEEQAERTEKLTAALKSLTPSQLELVKLLRKGMKIREIARTLGKSHVTVLEMRKAVQKKFEKLLR